MGPFRLRHVCAPDPNLQWQFLAIAADEPNADAAQRILVVSACLAG